MTKPYSVITDPKELAATLIADFGDEAIDEAARLANSGASYSDLYRQAVRILARQSY